MQNALAKKSKKPKTTNLFKRLCAPLLASTVGLILLSACTEIQATKAVVSFATEDRPFGDSLQDTQAEISLKSDLFRLYHTYPLELVLLVSESRALVAGYLDSQDEIDAVIATIWENPYITKVYNHLEVLPKNSLVDDGTDMVLAKLITARLLLCEGLTSANYKTAVFDNIAYVLGLSASKTEAERAIAEIKKVAGLRKIISYVIIESDDSGAP